LNRRGRTAPPERTRKTDNGHSCRVARTSNSKRQLVAIQSEEVVRGQDQEEGEVWESLPVDTEMGFDLHVHQRVEKRNKWRNMRRSKELVQISERLSRYSRNAPPRRNQAVKFSSVLYGSGSSGNIFYAITPGFGSFRASPQKYPEVSRLSWQHHLDVQQTPW